MNNAELSTLQKRLRQMLPDLGIAPVLEELKKALPEQTVKFNSVFQLETRLNTVNKDKIRGIVSQEDLDIAYNKISSDLLDLIDSLETKDFDVKTAESSVEDKAGSILYRIPHTMEVEEEYRCIVRLAFDPETVVKNIELTADTVVKDVRVSEVMEVELVDPNATPCFTIRRINSVEQFLEKSEYTEWIFFVKPLVTGILPLVLKVSVKELINEKERIKEIVLEETINVIAEPAPDAEDAPYQSAGYSFSYANTPGALFAGPKSDSGKRRNALLLIFGVMVASGLFATAVYLNWVTLPGISPADNQEENDRVFWEKMYKEHTRSSFETYLLAYPNGQFTQQAHHLIDSLMSLDTIPVVAPQPVDSEFEEYTPVPVNVTPEPQKQEKPERTKPTAPKPTTPAPPKPSEAKTNPERTKPTRKSGFTMVTVKGGKHTTELKGCAGKTLTIRGFRIGKYEITQADWKEIMGSSPSDKRSCDDCPIESVSFSDIQRFIQLAGKKHGKRYRLPYEVEWEYAARGGLNTRGMKYAGSNRPNEVAWFDVKQEGAHEVGLKNSNELEIFDMSGNVWEWCEASFPAYLKCPNSNSKDKPIRGGSWGTSRRNMSISEARQTKSTGESSSRSSMIGLRLIEE